MLKLRKAIYLEYSFKSINIKKKLVTLVKLKTKTYYNVLKVLQSFNVIKQIKTSKTSNLTFAFGKQTLCFR